MKSCLRGRCAAVPLPGKQPLLLLGQTTQQLDVWQGFCQVPLSKVVLVIGKHYAAGKLGLGLAALLPVEDFFALKAL